MLTITGWGKRSSGATTLPRYMEAAQVPATSDATCDAAYADDFADDMFCAGLPGGGVDTCQGDSGGPIVAPGRSPEPDRPRPLAPGRRDVVGRVLRGPGKPGVYARLGDPRHRRLGATADHPERARPACSGTRGGPRGPPPTWSCRSRGAGARPRPEPPRRPS